MEPIYYVRFSRFYWHFEILNRKMGYYENFFVFHLILMKLGEVVVTHVCYNFTKFLQKSDVKQKKVY